jgi:anti-sigma-K factor RskA
MDKEQFLQSGLLEQYVLKLTSPEEEEIVLRFIEQYPEVGEEIQLMQQALEAYAKENAVAPPPGLREQVLSNIESPAPSTTGIKRMSLLGGFGIAAAFTLGLIAFVLFQGRKDLQQQYAELESAYAELASDCTTKQERSAAIAAQLELLRDPATKHVHLRGTDLTPDALVVVYWNDSQTSGMLQIENLPPPPTGKTYQIWADVEGEMINAGVFDGSAIDLQPIAYIEDAESLNITLEPEGGSEHPTVSLLQANGKV